MVAVLSHSQEHRGDRAPETRRKSDELRLSHKPSVAMLALPDVRREKAMQGVSGVRYVCRCIVALLPNCSQDGRSTVIAARSSFSKSSVDDMFSGLTKSVKDLKVLEIALLLKSQGMDPTQIQGGEILRQLFGGQE